VTSHFKEQPLVDATSPVHKLAQSASPRGKNQALDTQLDQLLAEASESGLSDRAVLDAVFSWAAGRAYEKGGYPVARTIMLNTLEEVLLREVCDKTAA
jgi:hypothetical protein